MRARIEADRRVPARHPARRHPRPVLRPGGGDGGQCPGGHLRRARKPCRVLFVWTGHDALRRRQLHLPRSRQAPRLIGEPSGPRHRGRLEPRGPATSSGKKGGEFALDAYCVNLNKKAEVGKIDPLIGREPEVNRTIQILCRRQKNNPLYVGDPGVGKTAIAEGLARRIVRGEVPEVLKGCTIFQLDMGALLAGTRYRGVVEHPGETIGHVLGTARRRTPRSPCGA